MNRAIPMLARMLLILVTVALPASGCASARDRFIEAGYDPAYVDGYEHGHTSGYFVARGHSSRIRKDANRYNSNPEYRRGWDDGYSVSNREYHSRR
jgi:hypothetical protein